MSNSLDAFFEDKVAHEIASIPKIDKVLCILEGGDELSFIKKVYEVYNQSIECQVFFNHKIKLSYGSNIIEWQGETAELRAKSKKICNFRGGDTQEGKAPEPILRALLNEDLELYKAIIVMFDKDRDFDNIVEIKSKEILEDCSTKILFLSNPCFEKETITFFDNAKVQKFIEENYETVNKPRCQWYKQNYGRVLKLNPIKRAQNLSHVLDTLEQKYLEDTKINDLMAQLIDFIKINIEER